MTKPRLMDWLLLIYVMALASAPHAMAAGIFPNQAQTLLALFPSGFFLVALALIVIKSLIPVFTFEFGHSFDRWLTIGFLTVALSLFGTLLHGAQGLSITLRNIVLLTPIALSVLAIFYALLVLFLGATIGPRRRPSDKGSAA